MEKETNIRNVSLDLKIWYAARAKYETMFQLSVCVIKHQVLFSDLPNSFISNACLTQESVKFLKGFKSKCIQQIIDEDNSYLNAEFYYKNISVVSSPNILNLTSVPINQTVGILTELRQVLLIGCVCILVPMYQESLYSNRSKNL